MRLKMWDETKGRRICAEKLVKAYQEKKKRVSK